MEQPIIPFTSSEYGSFYDIEIHECSAVVLNENTLQNPIQNNNQYICNKKILNLLILLFFIGSVTFIIYDHHKIIGYYLNQLQNIM